MMVTTAYKLFRVRTDGSIGPLFISKKQRLPLGVWLEAKDIPTKGYCRRPGWHAAPRPEAPHLTERNRAWFVVQLAGAKPLARPEKQGGTWYTAKWMRVVRLERVGYRTEYRRRETYADFGIDELVTTAVTVKETGQ